MRFRIFKNALLKNTTLKVKIVKKKNNVDEMNILILNSTERFIITGWTLVHRK